MTSTRPSRSRVTLFVDSLEGGGAQRQIVVLANVLNRRGYDVAILTYYPGDQLSRFLDSTQIRLDHLPRRSRYDFAFLGRLVGYFRATAPDCIISYLTTTNFWARAAGRLAGVSHIITSERSISLFPTRAAALRERLLARLSTFIVNNSQVASRNMAAIGIPPTKLRVIYNGLDLAYFQRQGTGATADLRRSLGIPPDEFVVLLPGRLSAEKNHVLLVDAAVRFARTVAPITVLFAGNEFYDDVKASIVARISELGESSRFRFLGPRSDMPTLYSAVNAVVLPSLWEGFPNVIVEAMACGTPVVASDVSDNAVIVQNGITGFVFPSNDGDGLLAALSSAFRLTPDQRRSMGEQAMQRATELCSLDRFGDRYVDLIEGRGAQAGSAGLS